MKVVSKTAMVVAWAHVIWMTAGFAAPAAAYAQSVPPTAAPAPSHASAGGDVIELKTGGLLRGTLVDTIPNQRARIQLVTGEVATVPWQDIANIVRGDGSRPAASAPTAPAASAPTAPAVDSAPVDDGMVYVHIVGSDGAELQRDTGDHKHFDMVCSAPCDQRLPLKEQYRIGGSGIRNSRPFKLVENGTTRRTLYVDEASKGSFVLGIVGVSVGPAVALIGLIIVLANAAAESIDGEDNSHGESVGWIVAAAGHAIAVGGGVLMGSNAHSSVSQTPPGADRDGRLPGPSIALGGPGFRNLLRDTHTERLAPPTNSVPIFSASF
jgi:hypothetical protein